jgi:hypothetical protein
MSALICVANPGEITSGTSAKTLVQIVAPANQRLKILEWGVFCKGVTPTDVPLKVRLLRQTTTGTMSALTLFKRGTPAETIQSTAQQGASAEPTAGDVLAVREVHPQLGYQEKFAFGQEIIVPGGGRVGIEVTAAVSISVVSEIVFEE